MGAHDTDERRDLNQDLRPANTDKRNNYSIITVGIFFTQIKGNDEVYYAVDVEGQANWPWERDRQDAQ